MGCILSHESTQDANQSKQVDEYLYDSKIESLLDFKILLLGMSFFFSLSLTLYFFYLFNLISLFPLLNTKYNIYFSDLHTFSPSRLPFLCTHNIHISYNVSLFMFTFIGAGESGKSTVVKQLKVLHKVQMVWNVYYIGAWHKN